jgi:hypothetical protein
VLHSGHTIQRGGDLPLRMDSRAYYFSFAPFINDLESEDKPNIGQPLFIAIGIFLLSVMNLEKEKNPPSMLWTVVLIIAGHSSGCYL